jgi:hypothetical protein
MLPTHISAVYLSLGERPAAFDMVCVFCGKEYLKAFMRTETKVLMSRDLFY